MLLIKEIKMEWNEKLLGPRAPEQLELFKADDAVFGNVAPVCPRPPCASLYDEQGNLPLKAHLDMLQMAQVINSQVSSLPKA
jgi:hypothetical protein